MISISTWHCKTSRVIYSVLTKLASVAVSQNACKVIIDICKDLALVCMRFLYGFGWNCDCVHENYMDTGCCFYETVYDAWLKLVCSSCLPFGRAFAWRSPLGVAKYLVSCYPSLWKVYKHCQGELPLILHQTHYSFSFYSQDVDWWDTMVHEWTFERENRKLKYISCCRYWRKSYKMSVQKHLYKILDTSLRNFESKLEGRL